MRSDIQIFNSEQFGYIRTAGTPEEPLFCLIDVCKALELNANVVRQRLDDEVCSTYPIPDNLGRIQQTNFINEDGLYDVIFDSRKPEAKKFRKWVTSEVLPSIRKTGAYMTSEFLTQSGGMPYYLSGDDITRAISGLDVLVVLAKRQRKLLEKVDKLQYTNERLMEHNKELTQQVKQLSRCKALPTKKGKKGGADL